MMKKIVPETTCADTTSTSISPVRDQQLVTSATDTDVRIRPYRSSDLEQIRTLFVEGMRDNSVPENYILDSLATDLADIKGTYMADGSDRGAFFVMERRRQPTSDDDEHNDRETFIIAMVGLEELPKGKGDGENDPPWCELRRMSVHSSERGKGRGSLLLRHLVEHARKHDVRGIKLTTGVEMPAMHFYEAGGFTDCGRMNYSIPKSDKEVTLASFEMIL